MEEFNAIDYHQARDFSKKINATFEFFRQNFKSLVTAILVIAGPPILVASLIIATFMGEFLQLMQAATLSPGETELIEEYFASPGLWMQFLLIVIFAAVSSVMLIATINNYLLLYGEKQSNQISVSEVWTRVRQTFWMYFATALFFFLLAIAFYIVLLIPVALFTAISEFLLFFGMLFMFGAIIYAAISVSLTFFIRAYEGKGFFEAIGRSYRLVQGKWWSTFGLLFILYLIAAIISYIPMIPFYGMMMASMLHSTAPDEFPESSTMSESLMLIFFAIYYLFQMVLSSLPNIGIAFQYFNLVELKESAGLMNKIGEMGQDTNTPQRGEEHY